VTVIFVSNNSRSTSDHFHKNNELFGCRHTCLNRLFSGSLHCGGRVFTAREQTIVQPYRRTFHCRSTQRRLCAHTKHFKNISWTFIISLFWFVFDDDRMFNARSWIRSVSFKYRSDTWLCVVWAAVQDYLEGRFAPLFSDSSKQIYLFVYVSFHWS